MVQITDLSNELLSQIFEHFQHIHLATLYNLLFSCKSLHFIAKDIICRYICLSSSRRPDSALLSFLKQDYADMRVLSLRLRFERDHLYTFRFGWATAYNCIEPFYERLSGFERLTTFSLNQEGQTGYDAVLPASVVSKLLSSLPRSVVNLDLDTSGVKDIPDSSTTNPRLLTNPQMLKHHHICDDISNLIPQLKCLRLRVPHLCSGMMRFQREQLEQHGCSTSRLQVIMIKLDVALGSDISRRGTRECRRQIDPLSRSERLLDDQAFCNSLGELVQRGCFPDIKIFRVFHWTPGKGIIRDLVDGGMTESSWYRSRADGRYDIVSVAERGIEWTESANGARWPGFMGWAGNFDAVATDFAIPDMTDDD